MSEFQKEMASRIADAVAKLPEKDAMYILGRAEAQAEMAEASKEEKEG